MIGNARRIRSGHIQRKNYFYFGVQKRLWAFLNPIFTGGFSVFHKRKTAEGFPSAVFRMIGGSKMIFAKS